MDEGESTHLQARPVRTFRRLRVRVVAGPDAGASGGATVDQGTPVLTVGTAPGQSLVLSDPAVSRYHLELRHRRDGISVHDLGSTNGTWLGAARIERAVVPAGTRIEIGSTALVVEDAGAEALATESVVEAPGLVGVSEAMRGVARLIERLARTTTAVLIEGETGAGKEVVASALHDAGPRRDGPFVVVDCGSLPPTLIASQLFGHERGAFTGADTRRPGAFERAQGGTILLDEIGELPLELQPTLLGVLERRRFCRLGGSVEVHTDARVLAATNRDLRTEVNAGTFRADLYYRLAVARIVVPPLRERLEDLEPLIASFVERITGVPGENPLAASMDALRRARWSGNVRELRNLVEAALILGEVALPAPGAPGVAGAAGAGAAGAAGADASAGAGAASAAAAALQPYREARAAAVDLFERAYLARLIEEAGGNVSEAARRARMDRPYLSTLLKRHGFR